MTGVPHPFFIIVDSELRRLQLHAEADHDRLAQQAIGSGHRLRRWADWATVLAFVAAVAFVLANLASPGEMPRSGSPGSVERGQTVTQVMESHLLDPSAAQDAGASWL